VEYAYGLENFYKLQIDGHEEQGMPPSVAVGYLRYAAGDKSSPYFVVPGFGRSFEVTHWIDCLPENLSPPLWPGFVSPVGPTNNSAPHTLVQISNTND
jgi:hypothetical protein